MAVDQISIQSRQIYKLISSGVKLISYGWDVWEGREMGYSYAHTFKWFKARETLSALRHIIIEIRHCDVIITSCGIITTIFIYLPSPPPSPPHQVTKIIYHTMNKFNLDTTRQCLTAECWCPEDDMGVIQDALRRGTVSGEGREHRV